MQWGNGADFPSGDKNWLETHLWHAKRMKMETMWGYRLVCIDYNANCDS